MDVWHDCCLQVKECGKAMECCDEVHGSLENVSGLLGQLLLVRGLQEKLLATHLHPHTHNTTSSITTGTRLDTEEDSHTLQWPPPHEVHNFIVPTTTITKPNPLLSGGRHSEQFYMQ